MKTQSPQKPNDLESKIINVKQRKIFVSEKGQGFPVFLLHGGGPGAYGLSNFSKNIEPLAQHFRVIVPDLPGYGQSTKGLSRSDPFGDLAEGISGLMDALGIKTAHFVGNSYGGACAMRMALDDSPRVASMILMGTGGINTTRQLPTAGLRALLKYYRGTGPSKEKVSDFIRNYLVFDSSGIPDSVIEQRYQSSIDPEVIAAPPLLGPNSLKAAFKMDFTRDPRLRNCQTPTLAVWGYDDKVNRASGGYSLQKIMPNCDLVLFSKTGHWVQWERADEFNALSAAFLLRHTPKGFQG